MKVLLVIATIVAVSCAQDIVQQHKVSENLVREVRKHLEPRITGGITATPHEFPYQVGLYMEVIREVYGELQTVHTWCGGSIISKNYVVTAAHCLNTASAAIVWIGAHNILKQESDRKLIGVNYLDWIVHEQYDAQISKNDIALIKLPEEIVFSKFAKPINLPRRSQDDSKIIGHLATASGWGRTGDQGATSDVLRFAHLRVLEPAKCKAFYSFLFTETNLCVDGSGYKSVCPGDSGGPLAVDELNGSVTIVGLTSFGHKKGCEIGIPTAFTRVASYVDWIEKQTGIPAKA